MALPKLLWKKIATRGFAGDWSVLLDNIYECLQSPTYYNGEARTSAHAHSVEKIISGSVTIGLRGTPPVNPGLGFKWIIMRHVVGGTPTMITSGVGRIADTYQANFLYAGITKGAGDYTSWDAANPFSTGNFSGYSRITDSRTSFARATILESREAIAISFDTGAGGNTMFLFVGGAFIEPIVNEPGEAESDGRLYSMLCSRLPVGQISSTSNDELFNSANDANFLVFNPAVSTMSSAASAIRLTFSNGQSLTTRSGIHTLTFPLFISRDATNFMIGKSRGLALVNNMNHDTVLQRGGNDVAYTLSSNDGEVVYGSLAFTAI